MKGLARRIARLYPRHWRLRYGQELDALLEDAPLRWRDLWDVAWSALEMRMKSERVPRIVDLASRDVPGGYELESSVEFPRQGGGTTLVRNFCREIDLGDSCVTLNHWTRGAQPAQTAIGIAAAWPRDYPPMKSTGKSALTATRMRKFH
jgi:hypothetical protein